MKIIFSTISYVRELHSPPRDQLYLENQQDVRWHRNEGKYQLQLLALGLAGVRKHKNKHRLILFPSKFPNPDVKHLLHGHSRQIYIVLYMEVSNIQCNASHSTSTSYIKLLETISLIGVRNIAWFMGGCAVLPIFKLCQVSSSLKTSLYRVNLTTYNCVDAADFRVDNIFGSFSVSRLGCLSKI